MSKLVKHTMELIASAKTTDDAVKIISNANKQLSDKEAINVVKDLQDFIDGNMTISELEYWLKSRGLE